jgi:hypothetical protein
MTIDEKVRGTESALGPNISASGPGVSMLSSIDPYRGMEVSIHVGQFKGHHGTVKGSREKDGMTVVDIQSLTRLQNSMVTLDIQDVRELW